MLKKKKYIIPAIDYIQMEEATFIAYSSIGFNYKDDGTNDNLSKGDDFIYFDDDFDYNFAADDSTSISGF